MARAAVAGAAAVGVGAGVAVDLYSECWSLSIEPDVGKPGLVQKS